MLLVGNDSAKPALNLNSPAVASGKAGNGPDRAEPGKHKARLAAGFARSRWMTSHLAVEQRFPLSPG